MGGRMRRAVAVFVLVGLAGIWLGAGAEEPFPKQLVSWSPDPDQPVFAGTGADTWDKKIRERGWIHVEDGIYHLFYTGYNEERAPHRLLGHAWSRDGVHWTRDPDNPIHREGWVEDMCIVPHAGTYYMFAEGKDDIAHLLTSNDLRHWTERGPLDVRRTNGEPITPGPYGTPFVIVEGDTWNLLYERGDQGVWLARSRDGRVWTNVRDEPVLAMGPEPYDRYAVAVNQVVRRDGFYYAFYHANAHKPWKDWTTCLARSRDLIHWEKYPGNPIFGRNCSSGIVVTGPSGTHLFTMHPEVRRFSNPPGDR